MASNLEQFAPWYSKHFCQVKGCDHKTLAEIQACMITTLSELSHGDAPKGKPEGTQVQAA